MGNIERIEWDIAEIDASMGDGGPKHWVVKKWIYRHLIFKQPS